MQKNKITLLTIAAATFLLIPGASAADLNEPQIGDGDGLPSYCYDNGRVAVAVDLIDDPCTQTCTGAGNVNVAVTLTGDISQCSTTGDDPITCVFNVNVAVSVWGDMTQCTGYGRVTCLGTLNVAVGIVSDAKSCVKIIEEGLLR